MKRANENSWQIGDLEKRIMLDGDAAGAEVTTSDVAIVASLSEQLVLENTASSIVFVDAGIEDIATLLEGVDKNAEVVLLDAGRSGIDQVTEVLAGRKNVASLHFLTHGDVGEIQLGSDTVNQETLREHSTAIQAWATALTQDADILLYGCDVAGGESGNDFVRKFAAMTQADVAASVDKTGSVKNMADWELEKVVGAVTTELAFSSSARADFSEVLIIVDFEGRSLGSQGPSFTDSGYQFTDGGWQSSDLVVYGADRGYDSQVLHPDNYSRSVTIERADGTAFDMASFDYAAGRFSSTDATVTGYLANGSEVTSSFASSSKTLSTLNLDWSDLDRVVVDFRGGSNEVFGALDNFNVTQGGGDPGGEDAIFSFAETSLTVDEGVGSVLIEVNRSGNTDIAAAVNVTYEDGTALRSADYLGGLPERMNFAPGETSKLFTLNIIDDTSIEGTESLTGVLLFPSEGAVISGPDATINIVDNDSPGQSAVDDFEEFSGLIGDTLPGGPGIVTDGGFRFTDANPTANGGLRFYGPDQGYDSTVLHSDNFGRTIRLERNDGASFDLQSFDFAAGIWNTPTDARVTGRFANGSRLVRNFETSTKSFETLSLGWTGLRNVEIDFSSGETSAYGALDNFRTGNGGGNEQGVVSITEVAQTVSEGGGSVTAVVTYEGDTGAAVDIETVNGSAVAGQDFVANSTTLFLSAEDPTRTFTVDITDDNVNEGDEQFTLRLRAPSFGTTVGNATSTITIVDNDAPPTGTNLTFDEVPVGPSSAIVTQGFSFTDAGPGGSGSIRVYGPEAGYASNAVHSDNFGRIIRMQRTDGASFDLSSFEYGAGRWNALTDATVTGYFADGSTQTSSFLTDTKTFSTSVLNWTGVERVDFDFAGGASEAYGALDNFVIGEGTSGTPGTLSIPASDVITEGPSTYALPVTRSGGTDGEVSVDYVIVPSSAVEGDDYTGTTGTITFADGQQTQNISIGIVNDSVAEFGEVFSVEISNPTGGAGIGNAITEIDINDNDPFTGVVYSENFESPAGWISDPSGTDTATFGAWEQADPGEFRNFFGSIYQLGSTTSGRQSLVTGNTPSDPPFSSGVNGLASIVSPSITLPQGALELTYNYNMGHGFNASFSSDLRVTIVGENESRIVLSDTAVPQERFPEWISQTVDVSDFAGQTIQILVEANSTAAGRMEAGIDDVVIRSI